MTRRISLSLVLHNHQPVGNFGWVFADVFEQAYEPMVAAIERHPGLRFGLHYTGALLEWLRAERPEFLDRLRTLIEREQVEILGGGLYEPVLASLPERDRIGQLMAMADTLETTFGGRPAGAWLAERVWEPSLPTSLAGAGYGWTILDDAHFRAAAIPEGALWGPYETEDQGQPLTVFGTEQGLRYLIPFKPVEDVIEHLRRHATEAGDRLGMMGDDGEKFGAWPTTHEHCWGKGAWVERFLDALETNADWLTTVRPSDWLASHRPIGRVYLPTGSYAEMGQWALPRDESEAFGAALQRAQETNAPEARWLRGAFWRNFQVRYREINDLHKQMLRASAAVVAMPTGAPREAALDHLYRGQSNDCYWHGLFGGIYIAHMRAASFEHLIAAEDLADRSLGRVDSTELRDLDLDGRDEVLLATDGQTVVVDLAEGAGIGSWDLRAARHALAGVLRRRRESYHERLLRLADAPPTPAEAPPQAAPAAPGADRVTSIHELVRMKEPGLAERLTFDAYERRSGLVRILPADATPETWAAGGRPDLADLVDGEFVVESLEPGRLTVRRDGAATLAGRAIALRASKLIAVGGSRLEPWLRLELRLENRSDRRLSARIGVEWAITMLGGGGNPQAWWESAGARSHHDSSGQGRSGSGLAQGNDWLGIAIRTVASPDGEAWWAPIETISNSEDGFERTYQGSALLTSWLVDLAAGEAWAATVEHHASVAVDRAVEELAAGPSGPPG
jgi:4-alpha-glucanotransferase